LLAETITKRIMSNDTSDLESNPLNVAIIPPKNSTLHINSDLKTINITFDRPIDLYKYNITIYQIDNSRRILRQLFEIDSKVITTHMYENTITLRIIDSVFNIPGATYSLKIDEKFFRYNTGINSSVFPNANISRLSIQYKTGT